MPPQDESFRSLCPSLLTQSFPIERLAPPRLPSATLLSPHQAGVPCLWSSHPRPPPSSTDASPTAPLPPCVHHGARSIGPCLARRCICAAVRRASRSISAASCNCYMLDRFLLFAFLNFFCSAVVPRRCALVLFSGVENNRC